SRGGPISPVGQLRSGSTPTILESDQAWVVRIGATEVERASSVTLPVQNCIPDQVVDSTEVVKPFIRTPILVNEDVLERESENARDGSSILRGHTDLNLVAEAAN